MKPDFDADSWWAAMAHSFVAGGRRGDVCVHRMADGMLCGGAPAGRIHELAAPDLMPPVRRLPRLEVEAVVMRLVALRRQLEFTTKEVAAGCGVSEFVLRKVEQGVIDPTVTLLLDYAVFVHARLAFNFVSDFDDE